MSRARTEEIKRRLAAAQLDLRATRNTLARVHDALIRAEDFISQEYVFVPFEKESRSGYDR